MKTNGQSDWRSEYDSLLKQLGVDSEFKPNERRRYPRFDFNSYTRNLIIKIGDSVGSLADISVSGLSFYSSQPHKRGETVNLNFDDQFEVNVEIKNIFLDSKTSSKTNIIYRFGTKFMEESDGYRCTVSALRYMLEIMKQGF
ncbi:MAG: PilZ domain-containing protein [Nitrospinae bacterium]|nr:PilZ domain-containing protein [Nitrospinota bacterium]